MKVKKYFPSWPPLPGGAFAGYQQFPIDQSLCVDEVYPPLAGCMTFTCRFQESRPTYDVPLGDQPLAEELSRLLSRHQGTTLEQFGELRLDY
jgi:hypothetical protein